ncbi:MAG: membrane dipeptidase [Lachnospiraceae bacterium]|nr:membrane dipeptidase [Lachnospiraceae bacterium]
MYFDAHSDIWADVTNKRLAGETDVIQKYHTKRLKSGNVEGTIFVIWVDPPYDRDYVARTKAIFQCMKDEMAETGAVRFVKNYDELMQARKEGEFYVMTGIEGMAYLQNDIARLDDYYEAGARHGMLTWNESNSLGHGAATGSTEGLSDFGKLVVKEMQKKGMIVDTSHLNEAGFWDIAKLSTKPIIASHSNCRAICDSHRNLTDEQLKAIRDLNGVVGLNSYRNFIDDDISKSTVDRLAQHADRMITIMGIDHVGCGFDFFEFLGDPANPDVYSGDDSGCINLEDCTKIGNLFACFERMGMSKEEMEKIAFGNFHRVIKECVG